MALSPASWVHHTTSLRMGDRVRVDHDCGAGRTLTVRRDERGLHAFCFRCNDSGWQPPEPEPLEVRLARLAAANTEDTLACTSVGLPAPMVRSWDDWPAPARLWLLKAGLSRADLPRLGAYYHPPTNRVVLPVLMGGRVVFWQARSIDGRLPKYLAPPVNKATFIPVYGSAEDVTLTEDILSAYKVGKVGEAWSMMGTSASALMLGRLASRGCKVNVWLDPDAAGRKAVAKLMPQLQAFGIKARDIRSMRDPKLVHIPEIKELLWNTHQQAATALR
jgi:hypothetical protein